MAIGKIKLCLAVDKLSHPQGKLFPARRQRELIERADAFEFKYAPHLKAVLDLKTGKNVSSRLRGRERELLSEIVNSSKEIICHAGSGIVEDHVWYVRSMSQKDKIIGDYGLPKFLADGYLEILNELDIGFASFHLSPGNRIIYVDTSEPGRKKQRWHAEGKIEQQQWMKIFEARLAEIRQKYQQRLAFENVPLHPNIEEYGWATYVCKPEFISGVFRDIDNIFFLLDLCHAQVSFGQEKVKNSTIERYLCNFPLEKIAEIHISGTGIENDQVVEAHGMPEQKDLQLLKWMIAEQGVRPQYITIEHYNEDNLIRSFDEVRDLLVGL